jgi:hypothetical protein
MSVKEEKGEGVFFECEERRRKKMGYNTLHSTYIHRCQAGRR